MKKKYITRDIKIFNVIVKGIDVKNETIIELTFVESNKPTNETKYLTSITTDDFKPSYIVAINEVSEKRGMTIETFVEHSIPMLDYRTPNEEADKEPAKATKK